MDSEPEFDDLSMPESENVSPTEVHHHSKLKRLKKKKIDFCNSAVSSSPLNESDELEKENEEKWDDDGFDPLFGDPNPFSAKRVLEFDENERGFSDDDEDFELKSGQNDKNKKKRSKTSSSNERLKKKEKTAASSIRMDKKVRKAQIDQQADFQRVMREKKGVGFKPAPVVEKSIYSVLEKIRQRKLEVSKKLMPSRSVEQVRCENMAETSTSVDQVNVTSEDKAGSEDEQPTSENAAENSSDTAPLDMENEDKPQTSDEQASINMPLVDEISQSFRAPINDTQDLIFDSERSNSQGDELNESCSPVEDIAPSAPSLSLKFDSALPDDISSDEEGSDKENVEPHPKHQFSGKSATTGVPVKAFLDEEAVDDDSDNDVLHSGDKDEEDGSDMEEYCDYIATDFKEKQSDREKNNQLHQQWDQQQEETRTESLLHKLKYGTKKSEPSLLDDDNDDDDEEEEVEEDADKIEVEEDESDEDVSDIPASRATTKKLKSMIPHMFTDEDDGFVSSEDEETERKLSKQCLLQKVEMEQQSKLLSPEEDETSREVFCRIKKLNVPPEPKKKAKTSSFFDSLLNKESSNSSSRSSFLRRASTLPGSSSNKQGPSTGKSYIFGRDDSNSRSSVSLLDEDSNLGPKENLVKKTISAKFTSSQAQWSTQHREVGGETAQATSLFDILKRSSVQTGYDDTRDNNSVDQQAVFAAFKSVKKQVKIEGRSYQGRP